MMNWPFFTSPASQERAGHEVATAESGTEASRKAALMDRVDLLIVDHEMPTDRGCDLAASSLRLHPATEVMHILCWHRDRMEADGNLTPGSTL